MVVLVSTLDNNPKQLIKKMNLSNVDTIIVNQSKTQRLSSQLFVEENLTILESNRLGLSASRNDALNLAKEDSICQIADDDVIFLDNYQEIVEDAYKTFPDADIIIFYVEKKGQPNWKPRLKKGKFSKIMAMTVNSTQVTFKKESLIKNNIKFDERFGIGTKYLSGEENILLFDAFRKKLKIYSYPEKISTVVEDRPSHWDRKIDENNCRARGAVYKRMSPKLYWLIILQFAIRKRNIMPKEIGILKNIKYMLEGAREFSKENNTK